MQIQMQMLVGTSLFLVIPTLHFASFRQVKVTNARMSYRILWKKRLNPVYLI